MNCLKRRRRNLQLIKKIISKKKPRIIFFLSFIRLKIFNIGLLSYPNSLQDDFTRIVKVRKLFVKNKIIRSDFSKVKIINWTNIRNFYFKRNCIFLNTVKIKGYFSGFRFIFFFCRKIFRYFLINFSKKNLPTKIFFNFFSQNLLIGILYNLSMTETIILPIKTMENTILKTYRYIKLYENR